jgi:hypothetical protein
MIARYEPTRLYIKELAGIKYLGKTTLADIDKYAGSGVVWSKRIKKYGKENIKTLWVSEWYYCPHTLQEAALKLSQEHQIVESTEWANMKPENGIDGNTSVSAKRIWSDPESGALLRASRQGSNNGRHSDTKHSFVHNDGTVEHCTMLELRQKYPYVTTSKTTQLVSGVRKSAHGWRIMGTAIEDTGRSATRRKLTDNSLYTFEHTDGRIETCTRVEFRERVCPMARGCVNEIVNGGKTRKGWSLKK